MTDQPVSPDPEDTEADEPRVADSAAEADEAERTELDAIETPNADDVAELRDEGATDHEPPEEPPTDEGATDHEPPEEPGAWSPTDTGRGSFDPGHWPPGPSGPSGPPGPYGPYGPQPPYPVRRLYRSRDDRKIGGVSAGVAEFLGIDPNIVRLVTLLFAITGIGIVAYLAAWLIVPLRPEGLIEPPRGTPIADERTLTIGFGVAALAVAVGIATGSWGVLAVALIAGGVWLLSEQTTSPTRAAAGAPGTPGNPAFGYGQSAYTTAPPGPTPYAAPIRPPVGPSPGFPAPTMPNDYRDEPPSRRRGPQRITWIVLSLLTLLSAIGVLAATGDWWDVSATRFLGIGVAIIAVGAVVGQIRGDGARGLIPLGILAALAMFPVSAVDGLLDEGVGESTYRPTVIEELEAKYEHGIGKLTVDLSQLDLDGRSETIDIDLGIGELVVIVSEDVGGTAELRASAGEVSHRTPTTRSLFSEDGIGAETGTLRLDGENGTLDLSIDVGLGKAELRMAED